MKVTRTGRYANEAGRAATPTRGIKKRKQMSFTVLHAAAVLRCTVCAPSVLWSIESTTVAIVLYECIT